MPAVTIGDNVTIHYRALGPEGQLIAASEGGQPLVMKVGGDEVFPAISQAVLGMSMGESKAFRIKAADAYGEQHAAIERSIPCKQLPPDIVPGDLIKLSLGDTQVLLWAIAKQWGTAWRVSTRHPLAGHYLEMQLRIVAHEFGSL